MRLPGRTSEERNKKLALGVTLRQGKSRRTTEIDVPRKLKRASLIVLKNVIQMLIEKQLKLAHLPKLKKLWEN
ncbi:hypothetical protein D3C78_1956710 [compost metagenome]